MPQSTSLRIIKTSQKTSVEPDDIILFLRGVFKDQEACKNMNRIEQLTQFAAEEPNDPFNHYALAMEYLKTDGAKALALFEQLLLSHPDYLATYYHAGNLLETLGQRERALEVLLKGISLARDQKQFKPLRELQSVYDQLVYD